MSTPPPQRRIGLWMIGARGSIATCVAYGLAGLRDGLLEPIGIATARGPLADLDWAPWETFVLGGHDVCRRSVSESAAELVRHGILTSDLVVASAPDAAAFEARVRPGILDEPDVGFADLDPRASRNGALEPRAQIEQVVRDLTAFRAENALDAVVVVNLASTEAHRAERPEWADLAAFESALQEGRMQPASVLYAYAAFQCGAAYVNFTPSRGSSLPALRELAMQRGLPHCGSDGKTGETLVKTALAPMFAARALRVLAWQGYNMLGNRDGEVLSEPAHRESKLRNKGEAVRAILNDPELHSHVGIDYVPSLQDWKTAWDFIHFEGFLGARMSLQFTWSGSDSALAAPLVLDLVRLSELALRRGEAGVLEHTACYFKAPLNGGTHDFHAQFGRLIEYGHRASKPARTGR
ncbi:MAG: inositol-3-phosphate synthase [Planctomycetes bacterium]|nr:inositol-3-phosphate synthase [Planctomycetota bacterium]